MIIFAGSLVARDSSGNATPGATATTLPGVGRAAETVDNSNGAAGDQEVAIEKGIFRFANSTAADEITRGDIGSDCYIIDDQTVDILSSYAMHLSLYAFSNFTSRSRIVRQ